MSWTKKNDHWEANLVLRLKQSSMNEQSVKLGAEPRNQVPESICTGCVGICRSPRVRRRRRRSLTWCPAAWSTATRWTIRAPRRTAAPRPRRPASITWINSSVWKCSDPTRRAVRVRVGFYCFQMRRLLEIEFQSYSSYGRYLNRVESISTATDNHFR